MPDTFLQRTPHAGLTKPAAEHGRGLPFVSGRNCVATRPKTYNEANIKAAAPYRAIRFAVGGTGALDDALCPRQSIAKTDACCPSASTTRPQNSDVIPREWKSKEAADCIRLVIKAIGDSSPITNSYFFIVSTCSGF